jgi:polyhydroxybutyrate depolymerase
VVVLHGGGGNAASMVARWADKARAEGLVVAFPDGISQRAHMGTWNAGGCCAYAMTSGSDDVGFIRAVIDEVEAAGRVDPRRVYLTGMSNGGMMSYRAALALSDRVAAVGIVAGAMFGGETPPAHPLPILIIHGVRDQIVPYEGGTSPMALVAQSQRAPFQAARTTVDFWRRADGCEGEPRRTTSGDVTVETSAPCRDGSEVVFYNLASANHTWPGAAAEAPVLERFRYDQINATDILWDFFRRHARS